MVPKKGKEKEDENPLKRKMAGEDENHVASKKHKLIEVPDSLVRL
jgi:hypothetical protein